MVLLLGASAGAGATTVGSVCHANGDAAEIPQRYRPIYAAAASRYKLGARGPAILASIHKHESGFGKNQGPPAGAIGHTRAGPNVIALRHWFARSSCAFWHRQEGRADPTVQ